MIKFSTILKEIQLYPHYNLQNNNELVAFLNTYKSDFINLIRKVNINTPEFILEGWLEHGFKYDNLSKQGYTCILEDCLWVSLTPFDEINKNHPISFRGIILYYLFT